MNTKKEMIKTLKEVIESVEKLEDADKILSITINYRNNEERYVSKTRRVNPKNTLSMF